MATNDITLLSYTFIGNECSSNEGCNSLSIVLMPWVGTEPIPDKETVFSTIFQFHDEIWQDQLDAYNSNFETKIPFHLVEHSETDIDYCLNQVFGRPEKEYDNERELSFFTWLQNLMVPSKIYIAGEGKMNPVAEFFITPMAPGWVGGILTGEIWT